MTTEETVVTVPVYMPDRTEVGRAIISEDGMTATITLTEDGFLSHIMRDQLMGLSVIYLDSSRVEDVLNEKEKNDGEAK